MEGDRTEISIYNTNLYIQYYTKNRTEILIYNTIYIYSMNQKK